MSTSQTFTNDIWYIDNTRSIYEPTATERWSYSYNSDGVMVRTKTFPDKKKPSLAHLGLID